MGLTAEDLMCPGCGQMGTLHYVENYDAYECITWDGCMKTFHYQDVMTFNSPAQERLVWFQDPITKARYLKCVPATMNLPEGCEAFKP